MKGTGETKRARSTLHTALGIGDVDLFVVV